MSIEELKARLVDVVGADSITMQTLGGRDVYSIAGRVVGVPVGADISSVETAIRAALASNEIVTPLGPSAQPVQKPAATPAPGSFAASLKALLADARAGVEQSRAEGLTKVQDAVGKLGEAKAAITHVTGSMAKTIHDEADAVMAELGQISNDLSGDAS